MITVSSCEQLNIHLQALIGDTFNAFLFITSEVPMVVPDLLFTRPYAVVTRSKFWRDVDFTATLKHFLPDQLSTPDHLLFLPDQMTYSCHDLF